MTSMLAVAPSPGTIFVLRTVEFVMVGLVLIALAWLVWREPNRRREWIEWTVPFLLLALSFGVGAWSAYRIFSTFVVAPFEASASELLETAGLAALMWLVLKHRWGRLAWVGFLVPVAEAVAVSHYGPRTTYWTSFGHEVAASTVALVAVVGIAFSVRRQLRYAGAGLLLVGIAHVVGAFAGAGRHIEMAETLTHALTLFGLTGLVLAVEQRSRDLFTQVFIRLNLAFIFLAGVLMVFASEAERAKRLNFAHRDLTELAEVARGYAMFYLNDESALDVLNSPVLFRRIVEGFGEQPDLRIARIRIEGEELAVSIDQQGLIDRRLTRVAEAPDRREDPLSQTIVIGEWPIFQNARPIGAVVLEQTRASITREMTGPILVIFFAFTSMVTIASVLIGAIVYGASERLRTQVEQIERSERLLMQAAKLASLGELVSGVAHEINNPLNVMMSRMDYLRDLHAEGGMSEEVNESLVVLRRHMERIRKIVHDLLSFARPHPIERRWMDLSDVVRRSTELIEARARTAGIVVRIDLAPDLPRLHADADRLEQVLINLLNNAVDAMPDGGRLEIAARRLDGQVVVSVSDTGVGIADDDLKKVFDPFFSTKHGKGTGLGLSISHRIVRDHGGQLWAESQPGRGSTFFISLSTEAGRE